MQPATAILTGNLPAEPNSFIGRERDLAELARLLGEVRAPATARSGMRSWALVKVMYYGRVRYTDAIPVVIEPAN